MVKLLKSIEHCNWRKEKYVERWQSQSKNDNNYRKYEETCKVFLFIHAVE